MLDLLEIEGYGCVQDATLHLSPIHALIGPNDSGKSTLLRALRTLTLLHEQQTVPDAHRTWAFFLGSRKDERKATRILAGCKTRGWEIQKLYSKTPAVGQRACTRQGNTWTKDQFSREFPGKIVPDQLKRALSGSLLLRLDPDPMREPSPLIPHGAPLRLASERGAGLAGLYDAIRERDQDGYLELNRRFVELFPGVKNISLRNTSDSRKSMGIVLLDGAYIGAEDMSEGMLYYLAFAALRYVDPVALLLIEEPENGLHPARIAEVVKMLREVSKTTQVILATHSPLVINELEGHEVSVVTRDPEEGTRITLLKDTHNYTTRSKIYANGELWVSYADGKTEAPLLGGGEP
jgi:energy-coupling factor transporter ATP-binding protein EcfA2